MNLYLDYEMKPDYKHRQPRLLRACSRDDPECGARRGVLRRRLVTVCPGRPGRLPARHYDLAARSSLHGSGGNAGDGSAAPGEKPPRWSAERRASRVMGRKAPRKRLACRVMCRPNGCLASTRTFLGAPPTPRFGLAKLKLQTPGAKTRRGNEMGCLKSE